MNEFDNGSENQQPQSGSDRIVLSDGRILKSGKLKKGSRDAEAARERAEKQAVREDKQAAKLDKKAAREEKARKAKEAKEAEKARFAAKKAKIEEEQKAKDEARAKAKEARKQAREEKARKAKEAKEAEKARFAAKKAKIEEEQKAKDEARAKKKAEKKAAKKASKASPADPIPEEVTLAEETLAEETASEAPDGEIPSEEEAPEEEKPKRKPKRGILVLQSGRELKSGKLEDTGKKKKRRKKRNLTPEQKRERLKHLNPIGVAIRIAMVLIAIIFVFIFASSYANSSAADESSDLTGTGTETETETTKSPLLETTQNIKGQLQTTEIITEEPDPYENTKTPAWAKGRWVPFSMVFTGDFNPSGLLDVYSQKGLYGIIDRELRSEMKEAALTMANQEFAFGTGGIKASGKQNTYSVDTQYASMFQSLGIRLFSLANDHCLDYGKDLLTQTFDNLDAAGIDYVGAGATAERAAQWQSYQLGKVKVAVIAASRVLPTTDWNAENSVPGVFSTYDTLKISDQIAAAKEENDIVVVYVHWGIEKSTKIEEYQRELAHSYVESGADLIIGSHPQVLQGIEYYKDVPIIYSLGSFMFHSENEETAILKVNVNRFKRMQLQLIPCAVTDSQTHRVYNAEAEKILSHVEKLSINAKISKNGIISQK